MWLLISLKTPVYPTRARCKDGMCINFRNTIISKELAARKMLGRLQCVIVFGVAVASDLVQNDLTPHPVTNKLFDDVLLSVG